jgi:hypothetical protein
VSIAALLLLRHVRVELGERPPQRSVLGRAADVAVGMGMHAAVGGIGSAAVHGTRGLRGRASGGQQDPAPWERIGGPVDEAAAVHGAPRPGFEPVPGGGGALVGARVRGRASPGVESRAPTGGGETGGRRLPDGAATPETGISVDGVLRDGLSPEPRNDPRNRRRPAGPRAGAGGQPTEFDGGERRGESATPAPAVPPIVETIHTGPLPLPPEPMDGEPPPDDGDVSGNPGEFSGPG